MVEFSSVEYTTDTNSSRLTWMPEKFEAVFEKVVGNLDAEMDSKCVLGPDKTIADCEWLDGFTLSYQSKNNKCLFKINFILIANSLDDPFNILNQGCKICIGPELDPFILHEAPKDFNQVQFRGIFRN